MQNLPLILGGRAVRESIRARLKEAFARQKGGALAIVQVGANEASNAYISQKKKFGIELGVQVVHAQFPEDISEPALIAEIKKLNADTSVGGIIVQLPLPTHLNKEHIQNAVALEKDVDGLAHGSKFTPATARAVSELLIFYGIAVAGKRVAVLGRSRLAGAPIAALLQKRGALVSVCHSKTMNTKEITRAADIIISAVGKPRFLDKLYFRNDQTQVVVDVGITVVTERGVEKLEEEIPKRRLVGDVDFENVKGMVSAISPVPGGVGPMTVAALYENLLDASIVNRTRC
mgnify:CR=1 FL=1